MELISECPVCASRSHSLLVRARAEGSGLAYQVCEACGHVYQSPRMTEAELDAFYAGAYRLQLQGTEEPTEGELLAQTARARATLQLANRWGIVPSRHLDLGCSSGALLEIFQQRFQCEGVGVEPGEAYRRYAQLKGLEAYDSLRALPPRYQGTFDVVTAIHVLEHLPDPIRFLAELRENWITRTGRLLLEVPNLGQHESFEMAHLHAFTTTSLIDTVRRAGFQVQRCRAHGGYRSPILRLYVTLVAQPAEVRAIATPFPLAGLRTRMQYHFGSRMRTFLTRTLPDWTWQSPAKMLEQ